MIVNYPWYKRKHYLHFDLPLPESEALRYVANPKSIAQHAFYPFIAFELVTPRIRKSQNKKKYYRSPKRRPIAYPSLWDGYIFSYYKSLLEPLYEKWLKAHNLDECVTAFRKTGENNITLAKEAFDFIKGHKGCQIFVSDIDSFFQKIDHRILRRIWAYFLNASRLPEDHYAVYKAITRYSEVDLYKIYNLFGIRINGRTKNSNEMRRICEPKRFRDKVLSKGIIRRGKGVQVGVGTPQGSSLSPLLSNMYLSELDLAMNRWATSLNGRYWRYCDDVLVVLPVNNKTDIKGTFDQELDRLALSRSDSKTDQFCSDELPTYRQLQYLGFTFNGINPVVRPSSIQRYYRKLGKAIRATAIRQRQESRNGRRAASFRKQALYNMYSELPLRGRKIIQRQKKRGSTRNFTNYVGNSAEIMESTSIRRQREKILKQFRERIRNR